MALSNAVLDFLSARGALKPLNQRVGEALEAPVIEGGAPVPASIGGIGGPVSTPVDSPAPRQIPLNERIGQWMEKPVIDGGAPIPETLGGPDRPQMAASHQPYSSPDMVSSHGMAPPTPVVATQERRSPVGRANTPGPQSELPTASEFVPQPVDREGSIVPSGAGLLAANPSSPSLPNPSAPTDADPYSFIPQEIRDLYTKKDPRFSDDELRKAQEADNRSRGLQDAGNGFKRATSLITGTPYREAAIKVNGVQDFLTRRGLAEQESQGEKQLALYAIAEMAKARESGRRLTLEQAKEIARQNWEAQKAATEHGYRMEEQGAGREFTREQNELNRKNQITAASIRSTSGGGMGTLTPEGRKGIVTYIRKSGDYSPISKLPRNHPDRIAIMNDLGLDPDLDLATTHATYGAKKTALSKNEVMLANAQSWERTGLANLNVMLGIADKIADTGSPWANRPVRAFAEGTGDPDMVAFRAAHETVVNEYAKILSGASGSAMITDAARREAEKMLPLNATPQQLRAAAEVLKTDAGNRIRSMTQQSEQIRGDISRGDQRTNSDTSEATVVVLWKGKRKEIPQSRLEEAKALGAKEVR